MARESRRRAAALTPGTPEFLAGALRQALRAIPVAGNDCRQLAYAVRALKQVQAWTSLPNEPKTWDRFAQETLREDPRWLDLIEIGVHRILDAGTVAPITADAALEAARIGARLAADPTIAPVDTRQEAGRKGGRGHKASNNVNSFKGNSAGYLVRRLKRDAPAIAEALGRGEYPSARAAARAAGLPIRNTLTVSADDVRKAVMRIVRHYGLTAVVEICLEARQDQARQDQVDAADAAGILQHPERQTWYRFSGERVDIASFMVPEPRSVESVEGIADLEAARRALAEAEVDAPVPYEQIRREMDAWHAWALVLRLIDAGTPLSGLQAIARQHVTALAPSHPE